MLNWETFFDDIRDQRDEKAILREEEEKKRRYCLKA